MILYKFTLQTETGKAVHTVQTWEKECRLFGIQAPAPTLGAV